MSSIELDILINQVAQGHVGALNAWSEISTLSMEEIRGALRRVNALAQQAGIVESDIPEALMKSGVKPTRTAAVLVQKGSLGVQLARITTLPNADLRDGWLISLALLSIADARRRATKCKESCLHWWHRDLGNPDVVRVIREAERR
ncbi:MAG: hypothetical protein IPK82_09850 [Polyangiaceae bacterium]|nr:hypothetical protein [Polyangiaceae bacterium]